MARIKDIAIRSSDPLRLADMLERVFGLTKLRYDEQKSSAALTDGYLYIAILKDTSDRDGGKAAGAIDHFGFYVDDLDATCDRAVNESLAESRYSIPTVRFHDGFDGWHLEMREEGWGWDDMIQAGAQLHRLEPVPKPEVVATRVRVAPPDPSEVEDDHVGFVRVAAADDLGPGCAARVELGDAAAILVVNVEGTLCAVQDACPHLPRFGRLSEGRREGAVLECPVHGSTFDARTGGVLTPPAARALTCYEVKVEDGAVWLSSTGGRV
jgi:3-phenylpropionate/trans-cinnamate dioxygenase ferredoxin component